MYGYEGSVWGPLRTAASAKGTSPEQYFILASQHDDPSWAFVDFATIEDATAVLTNTRNHFLDGRKLVVEYASPDAVRRGGGAGPRPAKGGHRKGDARKTDGDKALEPRKRPRIDKSERDKADSDRPGEQTTYSTRPSKEQRKRPRATPGAALALAKREQVAIIPSQGTKIKFD